MRRDSVSPGRVPGLFFCPQGDTTPRFAARRPAEWLEIPLGLPSKDAKSEAFRAKLFLPCVSQIQGALRAHRTPNSGLFPLGPAPKSRPFRHFQGQMIATFRVGGDEISTHAKFAKVWVGFPRFRATRIGTKLQ